MNYYELPLDGNITEAELSNKIYGSVQFNGEEIVDPEGIEWSLEQFDSLVKEKIGQDNEIESILIRQLETTSDDIMCEFWDYLVQNVTNDLDRLEFDGFTAR